MRDVNSRGGELVGAVRRRMVSPGGEDVGGARGIDELEEEAHGVFNPDEVALVGDFQREYGSVVVGEVAVV